ncbi:MAG: hypothetical protein IPH78_08590 [Bacteroidetes bacterium]|nr:hypothetical protein [Bacteroidota bacterium]
MLALSVLLTACNQQPNQKQIPVVGEIDSAFIASDTAMQLGLESSYEYHNTLIVNTQLVYDIIGWGTKYAEGELAIVKRGADNKPDTVAKDKRVGIIENSLLVNLQSGSAEKSEPQVLLIMRQPGTGVYGSIIVYQTPEFKRLKFENELPAGLEQSAYMGHDSFYVSANKLHRQFPLYKKNDANCCPSGRHITLSYKVKQHALLLDKIESKK